MRPSAGGARVTPRGRVPYRDAGESGRAFLYRLAREPEVSEREHRIAEAVVSLLALYSRFEDDVRVIEIAELANVSKTTARRLLERLSDRSIGFTYTAGQWVSRPSRISLRGATSGAALAPLVGKKPPRSRRNVAPLSAQEVPHSPTKVPTQAEQEVPRSAVIGALPEKYRDSEQQHDAAGADDLNTDGNTEPLSEGTQRLVGIRMKLADARVAVQEYGEEAVMRQLTNLERRGNVTNPIGWILSALRDDYELARAELAERIPDPPSAEEQEARARQMFPEKFV